jgi:hypothetical protein
MEETNNMATAADLDQLVQNVKNITEQSKRQLSPMESGGVFGALGGVAGNLYLGNQLNQSLGQSNAGIDQQIASLQDMYNPNGAVAQQMNQQLAAKDAAAGRNSQYSQRSAQLQALLAQHATQNAQTINQLTQQKNQGAMAQAQMQAQQLASLFNLSNKAGLTGYINRGLGDMWDSFKQPQVDQSDAETQRLQNYPVPDPQMATNQDYLSGLNQSGYGNNVPYGPSPQYGSLGSGTFDYTGAQANQPDYTSGSGSGTSLSDFNY